MHTNFASRPVSYLVGLVFAVSAVGLVGCDRGGSEVAAPNDGSAATSEVPPPDFDAAKFSDPLTIDNRWLPLVPGTEFVFKGTANRGQGVEQHRVVFTVTDLTKKVNGVNGVVMWDRDFNGGSLVESEITFFAQDDGGNVWLLGEYPEEYDEEGKFEGAPSTWLAGVAGAQPGILMPADPKPSDPIYLQGFVPDIDFQDLARVDKTGQEVCVPAGCYRDVMVIDEWDPLAQPQDGHQLKYHAPGVGTVKVEAVGGEEQELLELVEVRKLGPEELAEARREALRLDERAYRVNARWDATAPAEPIPSR
jgi:hypothetical protein